MYNPDPQPEPRHVDSLGRESKIGDGLVRAIAKYQQNIIQYPPPVGLDKVLKTRGKRKVSDKWEAKWEARGVSVAQWRKLPEIVKEFLTVLCRG